MILRAISDDGSATPPANRMAESDRVRPFDDQQETT